MILPTPKLNQLFVSISPIPDGQITLPEQYFVHPADMTAQHTVPSLSFLITHPGAATSPPDGRVLFDLGIRSSLTSYTEPQQHHLLNRKPYTLGPGAASLLRSGGIHPADIGIIILSHVHYDHHGDTSHFPRAQFIIGPGTTKLLDHGLGGSGASHQHFSADLLPSVRTQDLPPVGESTAEYQWESLGPFDLIDIFGDESIFVLNSPGHLSRHINLLCRLSAERWCVFVATRIMTEDC